MTRDEYVLIPLIARAIELGRGPPSLLEWVVRRIGADPITRGAIVQLACELRRIIDGPPEDGCTATVGSTIPAFNPAEEGRGGARSRPAGT